jgi:hypothetical protein
MCIFGFESEQYLVRVNRACKHSLSQRSGGQIAMGRLKCWYVWPWPTSAMVCWSLAGGGKWLDLCNCYCLFVKTASSFIKRSLGQWLRRVLLPKT